MTNKKADKKSVEETAKAPETKDLPRSLKSLIDLSNQLLSQYQQKLFGEIEAASVEEMEILGLSSDDGWRVDLANQVFVKTG